MNSKLPLIPFALLVFYVLGSIQGDICPQIITRAVWRARPPKEVVKMNVPVGHVFIHHSDGPTCNSKDSCSKVLRDMQNFHMDKEGWNDIAYSYFVGGDNKVYEGRGWTTEGGHTKHYNNKSIGICFTGNFMKVLPSKTAINAAKLLIDCGVQNNFITKAREIHGHRNAKCTDCPGNALYNDVTTWVGFVGGKLPDYVCEKKTK